MDRPLRVVTFGEAMLRLSPPAESTLEKAEHVQLETAGAEANVAVALARLGYEATWVSRLPRNALGRRIVGRIRMHGVDTSHIIWADVGRVGLYFVEIGTQPRPPTVIYDRGESAFSQIQPHEVDMSCLEGADLLHVTGITPALSASARAALLDLVRAARAQDITISYDLNYRAKLASAEDARAFSEEILPLVALFFLAASDASTVFGLEGAPQEQLSDLAEQHPETTIVLTVGEEGSWAWDGEVHQQPIVPGVEVDRIGRGDAFCAGFLFGWHERDVAYGLACGAALAALAQTYAGDLVWSTREDMLAVVEGSRSPHFR